MKRKILFSTVIVLTAAILITPQITLVHATAPIPVLFEHWGLGFGEAEYRQAGNNWISHASSYGVSTGDIVGEYAGNAYWIYHNWVGPYDDPFMLNVEMVNGHVLGSMDITEIMGIEKTGTILFRLNDVFGDDFAGTWVIYGGTDELKGLHGQGTWHVEFIIVNGQIVGGYQIFEGQIHFDN